MGETLEDLLALFDIQMPIKEEDLKLAKKKVLLLHPDKNIGVKNINNIFIKYKNALKKLELLYIYINPGGNHGSKRGNSTIDIDPTFKKYIEKNSKEDFIKIFNEMFDNVYIKDNDGYEKWLRSNDDIYFKDDIERSRKAVIQKNELIKLEEPISYKKDDYYSDLKIAHTNSVIPIQCEDVLKNKKQFKNVNEYIIYRKQNETNIMNEKEAREYLEKQHNKETEEALHLAYQYKKEEEMFEKRKTKYYSKFLIIE